MIDFEKLALLFFYDNNSLDEKVMHAPGGKLSLTHKTPTHSAGHIELKIAKI